jgi:hypothetical protein
MALTVATLAGFPAINTATQRSAGTPTDAATLAFTNGVYTQAGTQYVAGILDAQGTNPSRIFFADNNTGGGTQGTKTLPTLVTVTQLSQHGQSLQELPDFSAEVSDAVGVGGFLVIMNPPEPGIDSGQGQAANPLVNVPGYTTATPSTSYPWPQMRFVVTTNALLVLASTSTG